MYTLILLEVARQQVCMSVICKYVAFLKYRDLCTSSKIVAAVLQLHVLHSYRPVA